LRVNDKLKVRTFEWLFRSLFVILAVEHRLRLENGYTALLVFLLGGINEAAPSERRVGIQRGMVLS
jgi:hypothetical protein